MFDNARTPTSTGKLANYFAHLISCTTLVLHNIQDIKILVKKYGTIRAQVAAFTTFLQDYIDGQPLNAIKIKTRLNKFKEVVASLDSVCDELDRLDEEVDHTPERISIQKQSLDLISKAETVTRTHSSQWSEIAAISAT